MTAAKKFLFDTAFDMTDTCEGDAGRKDSQSEDEVPAFSQADMDAAREEGFAAGREEGIREAVKTTEHRVMESLTVLVERLSELFRVQDDANAETARNAITVAVTIARKMFPDLTLRNALGEVERLAEMAMGKALEASPVVVRVNPELRDPLAERIDAHTAGTAAEGRVTVSADADLPVGDCRIEWSDGGAERNTAAMWKDIDAIIERNLGCGAATSDQGATADRAADGAPEAPGESAQAQDTAAGETDDPGAVSEPATESAPETGPPGGPGAVTGSADEPPAGGAGETPAGGADSDGDAPADEPPADEPRAAGANGHAGDGRDDAGDDGVNEGPADPGHADAQETTATTAGG